MSPLCWCKLKKCAEGRPNKAMCVAYLYKINITECSVLRILEGVLGP